MIPARIGQCCCPLQLGISKSLKKTIGHSNHDTIKLLLNLGNLATNDLCLAMAAIDMLEQRYIVH